MAVTEEAKNNLLVAKLVYDGGDKVRIPVEMGTPREDQMLGTPAEQLSELAGRVCYDSLGKGRPSFGHDEIETEYPQGGGAPSQSSRYVEGYHDHILGVGHGSVLEHFNFTVEIPLGVSGTLRNDISCVDARQLLFSGVCANRPGVVTLAAQDPRAIRVTMNLRSVIDWIRWDRSFYGYVTPLAMQFATMLHRVGHSIAPHVISRFPAQEMIEGRDGSAAVIDCDELNLTKLAEPISDHERWISLYLSGSRGFSHEQVRHGDFTAISQRSTRYVDESQGEWVEHPLITTFVQERLADPTISDEMREALLAECSLANEARAQYRNCVAELEGWLISRNVDKLTARKQARGAARGYLGNALQTEMIFSASVAQWRWMLKQRCSDAADAEIRLIYNQVLPELKGSRYGDRFDDMFLKPAKDGIGMVLECH